MASKKVVRRDWRDLPLDLTAIIAKLLTSILDYVSFRGVCQSWRSAATIDNFDKSIIQLPWLMFMSADQKLAKNSHCKKTLKYVDLFNGNRIFNSSTSFPNYELGTRLFSCSGWILGVHEDSIQMELRHVTRGIRLGLPGLDTLHGFENWYLHERHNCFELRNWYFHCTDRFVELYRPRTFIKKMTILSNNDNFVVVVIWGERNQLGYSRPGECSWTVMDSWKDSFSDVICHNGIVYALDFSTRIVACDVCGENPTKLQQIFSLPNHGFKERTCYLVVDQSSGKFIIALKVILEGDDYIEFFTLNECDLKHGTAAKQIRMTDFKNKALFLGFNSSVCLQHPDSSSDFIKSGSVYYTDYHVYGLLYTRTYDLYETNTGVYKYNYKPLGKIDFLPCSPDATIAPLLWVMPSL